MVINVLKYMRKMNKLSLMGSPVKPCVLKSTDLVAQLNSILKFQYLQYRLHLSIAQMNLALRSSGASTIRRDKLGTVCTIFLAEIRATGLCR